MSLTLRVPFTTTPIAVALTLAMTVGASAQVASLVSPDESPIPDSETTDAILIEDRAEALLQFAQCMRDNGYLQYPDPSIGSDGRLERLGGRDMRDIDIDPRSEEFRLANEACVVLLEAARPEVDLAAEQERLEEQLLLAQCIRDAGYPQYPDPSIGSDGRLERVGGRGIRDIGIDQRSEEFRGAMTTCQNEIGLEESRRGSGALGPRRGGN